MSRSATPAWKHPQEGAFYSDLRQGAVGVVLCDDSGHLLGEGQSGTTIALTL